MTRLAILVSATFLVLVITPAYADTVEVTFTGTVTFVFQTVDPVVAGVTVGDPFTSVLTYNQNQPDLNPAPDIGHYFDYTFGLAVHTASDDVTVPGSTIAPIVVSNDDVNDSSDLVHNAASAGNIDHQWLCALILRNRGAHPHTVLENPGLFLSVPCTARGKT